MSALKNPNKYQARRKFDFIPWRGRYYLSGWSGAPGEHACYPRWEEKLLSEVAERGSHTVRTNGPTCSVFCLGTHGTFCPTHCGASLLPIHFHARLGIRRTCQPWSRMSEKLKAFVKLIGGGGCFYRKSESHVFLAKGHLFPVVHREQHFRVPGKH